MPKSLQSAKLWTAVVSQIVVIVSAVVLFLNPGEATVQLVSTILASISQIAAMIFGVLWGAEVGEARSNARFMR